MNDAVDQDQIKTQMITKIRWLSPVKSAADLPYKTER